MSRFARFVVVPLSVASAVAAVTGLAGPLATARAVDPGGPGTVSHFDQARKDCLGTARNTTSKIWYTVADGVLSDVYAPTIDTTNVETMQYVVTDGSTFTDLQTRDTTYTVASDPTGMVCTVTATARSGAYRLVSTYLTDTDRSSVVVRTQFVPLTRQARNDKVYVRLDATVGGNGGGGAGNGGADTAVIDTSTGSQVPVSYDTATATNAANRDYAVPSFLALRADRPFLQASSGFVGTTSDGLTQLDASHALTTTPTATAGNVEQTAGVNLGNDKTFVLALGFGTTQQQAVSTAGASVNRSWPALFASYELGWLRYDVGLHAPTQPFFATLPGLTPAQTAKAKHDYYVSANVVKASEDKTFPGAIVASLASPWGQAVSAGDPSNTYFGSYREVFARDLYEAWTALYTDGDIATARDTVRFLLLKQQQPDGSMPRNSLVNGKLAPDSFNTQLDEAAYPILMTLQSGLGGDDTLWPHVKAAANFVAARGPSFGPERWEEQSGYSPSTIAAEIAGLVAGAQIAKMHGDGVDARIWLATADQYQRSIKGWAVTTTGPLSADPYFIRISPDGKPDTAENISLGNGGPTLDQRSVIDAGFLELVRLGELSPTDPVITNSLKVVDATIERTTPTSTGWLRYNGDGYGDCYLPSAVAGGCTTTGAPWAPSDKGTGHIWPVLAAERAQQDQASGDAATAGKLLAGINDSASGVGLVPEQVWDDPDVPASPFGSDPTTASIGFTDGQAAGSAAPLTWGAASEVRLTADLGAGRSLEQPAVVRNRYVTHTTTTTDLTVTAPLDQTPTVGSTDTVTGTATPGDTVDIGVVGVDAGGSSSSYSVTVPGTGAFSVPVTVGAGTTVIVVTATSPTGGTAQTTRTVDNDVVAGSLLFDATDPSNDDNGPGNYAYPTSDNFKPGAYDLQDFQVYDTGSTVTFRVQTRDLTATFGSPLGAQLVDVYVGETNSAAPTSTAAAFPQRNYTLAAPWTRRIEVQGFGSQFVDATGATVGSVAVSANPISRYITFSVDKAALGGTPQSGWTFNVVLTGQDGFSPDNARAFQSVPQDFQFGVCAVASSDPHCTVDPSTVPKAMDVLTPSGTSQATELDYTLGPVVLVPVTMP